MTFDEILAGLQRMGGGQTLESRFQTPLAAEEAPAPSTPPRTPLAAEQPIIEPQAGPAPPDMTKAPPADLSVPMRDLGVSVNGTRRLPGPGGVPMYTNRSDQELAAAGTGPGGYALGSGGPAAPPPAKSQVEIEAEVATGGRQQDTETRLRDLLGQKRLYVNNPEGAAALDRQIATAAQELGLAGTEGMTGATRAAKMAETQRATTEAQTAPGAREKFGEEANLAREKIAGTVAASQVQGLAAHQVAANLGVQVATINAMSAQQLEAMKEGAARAEKAFDRETKRGELSGQFLATLGPSFNAIQVEKDPVKQKERLGYFLQSIKSVQDLLISGRGGQPSAGTKGGTSATPAIRSQLEAAAKARGIALKPGQSYTLTPGGPAYVY